MNPREKFIDVARRYVGISETSRNQFARMEEIWSSTNYPDGWKNREPYCAAFICHVVAVADKESKDLEFYARPKLAAVSGWKLWAQNPKNGVLVIPGHDRPMPGDIVSFLPNFSHIGLVVGFNPQLDTVLTIEANTNAAGDRDGDGIYEKSRKHALCGEYYRLPTRARAA